MRRRSDWLPQLQRLEPRLAMVGEGVPFGLPVPTVDPVGYLGEIRADINWGDGNTQQVNLGSQSVPNRIKIKFNYSLDRGFFAQQSRRNALQNVADSITQYFGDTLSPIVPGGLNRWSPQIYSPSSGSGNSFLGTQVNVSNYVQTVPQNQIIVFAGARNLPTGAKGVGSTGFFSTASGSQSFLNTLISRGQPGALPNSKTDHAPWGGSITFDSGSDTNWYFGADPSGIGDGQVDFRTFAAHELMHVLGFGLEYPASSGQRTSWQNLTRGSTFSGRLATAAYAGSGQPPVQVNGSSKSHWSPTLANNGINTLMAAALPGGERQLLSRLDLAALSDIGWQLQLPLRIPLDVQHVYADNPSGDNSEYPLSLKVRGATLGGFDAEEAITVTNLAPKIISVPATQTIRARQVAWVTGSQLRVTDPGYGYVAGGESFTYTLDWGNGSPPSTGEPTSVVRGAPGRPTAFNITGGRQFPTEGNYTARFSVEDDDGGTATRTFQINVLPIGDLNVEIDRSQFVEGDATEAMVKVSRDSQTAASVIDVIVDGLGEFKVPEGLRFAAGETTIEFPISVIDDQEAERNDEFDLKIISLGYRTFVLPIQIVDNEVPFFQNRSNRYDVDSRNGVTALDALLVINAIGVRGEAYDLYPTGDQLDNVYLDVSGDYQVSPVDVLQVINELARAQGRGQSEQVHGSVAALRMLSDPTDDAENVDVVMSESALF